MVDKTHNRYGQRHTKATRKKISKAVSENHKLGYYDTVWTDARRKKHGKAMRKFWADVRAGKKKHAQYKGGKKK